VSYKILKVVIAFALCIYLYTITDFEVLISFYYNLTGFSIFLIFAVSFILIFVSVAKWKLFLNEHKLFNPFWKLYRIYIIGYFFNNFFPSNIGGDLFRIKLVSKCKSDYKFTILATFMERFTGIFATLLIFILTLPFLFFLFDDINASFALIIIFPSITIAFVFSLFFLNISTLSRSFILNSYMSKFVKYILSLLESLKLYRKNRHLLLYTMMLSFLFNIIAVTNVYVVSYALNIDVSFFNLLVLVPSILLISSIPLSINSIGISEGAYVLCLSIVGLTPSQSLAIALLMRAKTFVISLLGGLFLISHK
jgi:glycosyltransferase 2 family protein